MRIWGYDISRWFGKSSPAPELRAAPEERSICYPSSPISTALPVITDRSALSISPVWSAIRHISEGIASLPFGVFERTAEGNTPAVGHPLYKLFVRRPHPHYSKFDFFQTLVTNACFGDGYVRIWRDPQTYRPRALELLSPSSVSVEIDPMGNLIYHVTGELGARNVVTRLASFDVIHIKGVTFTGINGEPVRLIHRDTFGAGLSAQNYSSSFFANGAHITGVVEYPEPLEPHQATMLSNRFQAQYSGPDKAGKVAVLDNNAKYQKIGLTPQEAALIDFRKLTVEDVARIFKIPAHLLAMLDRATFNNIEQMAADFVTHTLTPWVRKLEDEFNDKLFLESEIDAQSHFVRFNLNGIMRGDTESRAKFYTVMLQNGVMSPNEVRNLENMNDREGGDMFFTPLNMSSGGEEPKGSATEDQNANTKPAK